MFPSDDIQRKRLREEAYRLKLLHRGPEVYFRGLIEISNICRKNCLYCGIRCGNTCAQRYEMSDDQVLHEAQFALDAGYGSIAIQGGERGDAPFIERISRLVYDIRRLVPGGGGKPVGSPVTASAGLSSPANNLGITLSLGEQPIEVYREWLKAGASRYLLRIEASNRELYGKIHPGNLCRQGGCREADMHSYDARVQALVDLKSAGYILGTGVMIGLPFQTYGNLEEDLKFFKEMKVDMVGMGPYIPHKDTPLGKIVEGWKSGSVCDGEACNGADSGEQPLSGPRGDFWNIGNGELLELSVDMVARLRILMPHINIAATTALQVLDPYGREKALMAGANVIMPNMTETALRGNYSLYEGKQGVEDDAASTCNKLLGNLSQLGIPVGWGKRGDFKKANSF